MIGPWIWRNSKEVGAALLLGAYVVGGIVLFTGKPPPVAVGPAAAVTAAKAPAEVRVASIQFAARFGGPEENRQALTGLIREAAAEGAKIIVMPETAVTGYISADHRIHWHVEGMPLDRQHRGRDPEPVAERIPGESSVCFAELARELKVYLAMTLIEKSGEDGDLRYFNSMCLFSPEGKLAGHYRKLHPYPPTEDSWATPGDRGLQVVDTAYGKVAMAICYDIHFVLEDYAGLKPWTLIFSSAWVWEEHPADWFWHEMPARAAKHGLHVIGANWSAAKPQKWRGYGFSEIIRNDGKVLSCAHGLLGSEIVYADLPVAVTPE
jgi:predicted amidohydrolase